MKNTAITQTEEQLYPTHPTPEGMVSLDELAKLWVGLVLQQIQKKAVVFSK